MSITARLLDIYGRLLDHYGPQGWWPAETPFEMIVGAILTQAVSWANVERALSNLKAEGVLNPEGLRRIPEERLAELIHPAAYYNVKARKLKAFTEFLYRRYDGELQRLLSLELLPLRQELLSIYGIGPETADSIILYAAGKPIFVVDAYTCRIVKRLKLGVGSDYRAAQALFMDNLPHDIQLFQEYHALLVRLGKENCRREPRCADCTLAALCPTAQFDAGGRMGYNIPETAKGVKFLCQSALTSPRRDVA